MEMPPLSKVMDLPTMTTGAEVAPLYSSTMNLGGSTEPWETPIMPPMFWAIICSLSSTVRDSPNRSASSLASLARRVGVTTADG